jgi:cell wall-associated NlpC family hydrolase
MHPCLNSIKFAFTLIILFQTFDMEYGIVTVPAAPVRRKPMHRKEMVNQLLFGEAVQLLKTKGEWWVKVRSLHDGYEGWMTNTLLSPADETVLTQSPLFLAASLLNTLAIGSDTMKIPAGSSLPGWQNNRGRAGKLEYTFDGTVISRDQQEPSPELVRRLAMPWLNAPYLWGGRTPLGVDCSGFVQVIFKMMGLDLPRDAWQQAQQGKGIKKISESQPGDLAFFNNKEEIVHTGILLGEGKIIHASGKVRIDNIDKKGLINSETGKRVYKLEALRRMY